MFSCYDICCFLPYESLLNSLELRIRVDRIRRTPLRLSRLGPLQPSSGLGARRLELKVVHSSSKTPVLFHNSSVCHSKHRTLLVRPLSTSSLAPFPGVPSPLTLVLTLYVKKNYTSWFIMERYPCRVLRTSFVVFCDIIRKVHST